MDCELSGCSASLSATNQFYHRRRQTSRPTFAPPSPAVLPVIYKKLRPEASFQHSQPATDDAANQFYHHRRQTKRPTPASPPPAILPVIHKQMRPEASFQHYPPPTDDVDMAPLDGYDSVNTGRLPPRNLPSPSPYSTHPIAPIPQNRPAPSPQLLDPFAYRRRAIPAISEHPHMHHQSQHRPAGPSLLPSESSSYITAATARSFLTVLFPGKAHSPPDRSPLQAHLPAAPIRRQDDHGPQSAHRLSFHLLNIHLLIPSF